MWGWFLLLSGLILLFIGGEALLRSSISLAKSFGISKLLISAIIMGFGTSLPEMSVSIGAALKGSSDIALGNVIGSNTSNILLIVGLSALLTPILLPRALTRRDVLWMLGSTLALLVITKSNMLIFPVGIGLLVALSLYIYTSIKGDQEAMNEMYEHADEDAGPETPYSPKVAIPMCIVGLVTLLYGADVMVDGALIIARKYMIPETVIGLTIIALGTSLPELTMAVIASFRGHSDVVIGNVLGSNIFNILFILGCTSLVMPISVDPHLAAVDIWVMTGATALLSVLLMLKSRISRFVGLPMLLGYATYIFLLFKVY
ncbi:MAG: calcium/sodium antiporter [Alphaproteobacteria bacterium]